MEKEETGCWKYVCRDCHHITYIPIGTGMDVLCRRCLSYNVHYLGRVVETFENIKKSHTGG